MKFHKQLKEFHTAGIASLQGEHITRTQQRTKGKNTYERQLKGRKEKASKTTAFNSKEIFGCPRNWSKPLQPRPDLCRLHI
jgi:hypothetical protein